MPADRDIPPAPPSRLPERLTALDFETTGAVPGHPSQPWQIGLLSLRCGEPDPATLEGHWLRISPERPFNRFAPGRHSQLRETLALAPALPDLWPRLAPRLTGVPLVAHNAATERAVLHDAFPLHPFGPWIDTLKLARQAWPRLPSHALGDLLATFGLEGGLRQLCPGLAPHDARYDAAGAALLLRHLLRQPGWRDLTLGDLLDSA